MDRLEITDEVRALLSDDQLMQVADAREHTVISCLVCRGEVRPESDVRMSVVVLMDPVRGNTVVAMAHVSCMRSQTIAVDVPLETVALAGSQETVWVSVLRTEAVPAAALVWETAMRMRRPDSTGVVVDSYLDGLRRRGFVPISDAILDATAPPLAEWRLVWSGEDLLLVDPDGWVETFSRAALTPYPEWLEALERERRSLLVSGAGLGLERASLERIDMAARAGEVVAGTVSLG